MHNKAEINWEGEINKQKSHNCFSCKNKTYLSLSKLPPSTSSNPVKILLDFGNVGEKEQLWSLMSLKLNTYKWKFISMFHIIIKTFPPRSTTYFQISTLKTSEYFQTFAPFTWIPFQTPNQVSISKCFLLFTEIPLVLFEEWFHPLGFPFSKKPRVQAKVLSGNTGRLGMKVACELPGPALPCASQNRQAEPELEAIMHKYWTYINQHHQKAHF